MIEFKNVYYSVTDGRETKEILKNISFVLPKTGLIALIGPSGSGKTTILNLISKTINKTSGNISFLDINYDNDEENIDTLRALYLSIVFQDLALFGDLTIYENIKLTCKIKGIELDEQLFEEYLRMIQLDKLKNEIVQNLSRGERQRVAILRAIISKPKVILLDEPTSSLDKTNSLVVMNFLKEISKDTLVLFSSHDLDLVFKYTNEYIKIEYGEIVENTVLAVKEEPETILNNKRKIDINYIRKKIFHLQVTKNVFVSIFLIISLVLFLIPFINLTYNENKYTYDIYSKLNYDTYLLTSENNIVSFDKFSSKYSKLKTNDFYYDYLTSDSSLPYIGENVVINEDYNDYEIVITDYIKEILDNSNLIEENKITYGHYELSIKDIKQTNYKWYKEQDNESKKSNIGFLDYLYTNVYMNEYTFKCVNEALNNYKLILINDNYVNLKNFSVDSKDTSSVISGSNNHYYNQTESLRDNEIIISRNIAITLLEDENLSNSELIGKTITLLNKSYIIKDITTYVSDIVLSDDEYYKTDWIFKDTNLDKYTSFQITNKKDFINLMKDISDSNYNLFTPYSNDVEFCKSEIKSLKFISKYILVIAIVLFIASAIMLAYIVVIHNKKRLAIIRTLGLSKRNLYKILILKTLGIVVISVVVSILLYLAYYLRININILNQTSFEFFPVRFEYIGILSYIICSIIFIFMIFGLMIYMFNKKDLKDSIID